MPSRMNTATRTDPVNPRFVRRSLAALYDWLLVIALMMLLSVPVVALLDDAINVGNGWYQAALGAVAVVFFVGFWRWSGQTPGMRAWHLRLRSAGGGPVSWPQAALRFAAACLSLAAGGMGFWWMLLDADGLSWHDRISDTRLQQEAAPQRR